MPTRKIRRHVREIARNQPEGLKLQGHVSPATTNEYFVDFESFRF